MTSTKGLDVHRLTPADCAAALRSYPRRYTATITDLGDERPDDVAHRAGPDGRSAVDIVDHVARSIAMLGQALRRALVEDDPVLLPAVLDEAARDWQVAGSDTVESVLDFLTVECETLAHDVDHVDAAAWSREATVAGGRTIVVLDIVREAVRTGAAGLQAVKAAMAAARPS